MNVSLAAAQVWIGLCLAAIGFAIHRTGPAFKRHPAGAPVALLGLALILLHSEQPPAPESLLMQTILDAGPWFATAVIGTFLVLSGAPTYSGPKPLLLMAGWSSILVSWYMMLAILPELNLTRVLSWLSSILGIILAISVFALSVRFTERRTPVEPETPPLTDKERKYVQSVLRRHLEASDDT